MKFVINLRYVVSLQISFDHMFLIICICFDQFVLLGFAEQVALSCRPIQALETYWVPRIRIHRPLLQEVVHTRYEIMKGML